MFYAVSVGAAGGPLTAGSVGTGRSSAGGSSLTARAARGGGTAKLMRPSLCEEDEIPSDGVAIDGWASSFRPEPAPRLAGGLRLLPP